MEDDLGSESRNEIRLDEVAGSLRKKKRWKYMIVVDWSGP